jgi:hypothetical protein
MTMTTAPGSNSFRSPGAGAARFSAYIAIAVLLIESFARDHSERLAVALTMLAVDINLILLGFILAIAALARSGAGDGARRIVGWALAGLLLNGAAAVVFFAVVIPALVTGTSTAPLVGHWELVAGPGMKIRRVDLVLNDDQTFSLVGRDPDGLFVSYGGRWGLGRGRVIGLAVDYVNEGDTTLVGNKFTLGTVKTVDKNQMIVTTRTGEDVYRRSRR